MRAPTTSPWAAPRNSPIHGRGMVAQQVIPRGTRIIEYLGERITKKEADRRDEIRVAELARGGPGCVYIFQLNKRYDIDGSAEWNTARLINHSCVPNCESKIFRGHIWIVARREIAVGEELCFDYGYPLSEWRQHPCRCGARGCAGYIVAKAQRWRLRAKIRALRQEEKAAQAKTAAK